MAKQLGKERQSVCVCVCTCMHVHIQCSEVRERESLESPSWRGAGGREKGRCKGQHRLMSCSQGPAAQDRSLVADGKAHGLAPWFSHGGF